MGFLGSNMKLTYILNKNILNHQCKLFEMKGGLYSLTDETAKSREVSKPRDWIG